MSSDEPQASTTAPHPTPDLPGQLGRYRVLRKLGQGGMGAVYLAHDDKLDRHVALKVLPPQSINDPDAVARFQREAKALAKLHHPGIVQAHDSGDADGQHFLIMEYVEGTDLKSLLREKGPIAPTAAADYVHQAALALQHAHEQGLVHRDLKPSNLLLTHDGYVKILDLGLARFLQDQISDTGLTREGVGMGTPDYAAPEQFRDAHHVDARADIYALGCTLYHLLTGRVPFPGSSLSEKCHAHEHQEPAPLEELCPQVPAGLALTVSRMMAKRPAERFQTAREVAEALMPHVAGSSPSFRAIRNTTSWSGSQLTVTDVQRDRRRGLLWAVAGAAVAAVLVTAVFGLLRWPHGSGGGAGALPGSGETGQDKAPAGEDSRPAVSSDPNVLTVSQDAKDGGTYRTIGAALEQVRPGMTVRVLDAKIYPEVLSLTQASRHARITLEAPHRATLAPGKAHCGLAIASVPGVTVRGFRLQSGPDTAFLIGITDRSPGVVLDDLELLANRNGVGITVEFVGAERDSPPVLVHGCVLRGFIKGIQVSGLSDAGKALSCGRVVVQNNEIKGCKFAVYVKGAVHDLRIVGNRIEGSITSGLVLRDAVRETRDILIANNTLFENFRGFTFFDDLGKADRGKRIALRNNLFLASTPDLVFLDSGGKGDEIQGDGDGAELLKVWQIDHNFREVDPNKRGKSWIPAGTNDVVQAQLSGLSRQLDSPDYLRPDRSSAMATEGAGKEDPSLPRYVGALPPQDVEPWDWQRTWRMPGDARLFTVSKDPQDKADYDTLGKALAAASPWTTIRVLDAATYTEALTLANAAQHEGVCLEATKGATLVMPPGAPSALSIRDVPHVRLAGLRIRDTGEDAGTGAMLPLIRVTDA
jgi:serine/threonine protein kinase